MKRATMELGGHSPVVVFGDADPEKTADTIAAFKYRNAGQVCISPTRFYVQEDVYDRFLKRFTDIRQGAQARRRAGEGHHDGAARQCAPARRHGRRSSPTRRAAAARSQTGGKRRGNQGYFFEPTVITDVPDDSKIMTEEPFGPVAPIVTFKTFDEVVERANSLQFGLAAYAFTVVGADRDRDRRCAASPAWSASTASRSRRPRRRSAASRNPATATKAASRASEVYMNKKFIAQA